MKDPHEPDRIARLLRFFPFFELLTPGRRNASTPPGSPGRNDPVVGFPNGGSARPSSATGDGSAKSPQKSGLCADRSGMPPP